MSNTFICVKKPASSRKRTSSAPPQLNLERNKSHKTESVDVPTTEGPTPSAVAQMEQIMIERGFPLMHWIRIVHSGYGKPLWLHTIEVTNRPVVGSKSKAEGCFVAVLDGETVADVVDEMIAINLQVRRQSRFRDMKRANKSRVQFKSEPVWIALTEGGVLVSHAPPPF